MQQNPQQNKTKETLDPVARVVNAPMWHGLLATSNF